VIFVFNKRHCDEGEYIGRPSPLGNPYTHLDTGLAEFRVESREKAIEGYETWIREKMKSDNEVSRELDKLVEKYRQDKCLVLLCWCAPHPCHGDILREIIKEKADGMD
tara:strand:- start:254 stop:577 length:324 start_codon:yes stop_codon:yes gene_type:complete